MGQVSNREVISYYMNNHVNLFINVSESEGIPVSIMEAISFGIPVIATDVGGTSEIVIDGFNGLLLNKTFDIDKLVDVISCAILGRIDLLSFRKNARILWTEKYSCENNYYKFYENIGKS